MTATLLTKRSSQPAPRLARYPRESGTSHRDGKCAMRILYDEELNKKVVENEDNNITDPDFIASETIDLIALPSKEIVAELLKPDGHFEDVTLIWSQDSKWCAFYYAEPRVGYTTVYRENGKKFSDLNAPE